MLALAIQSALTAVYSGGYLVWSTWDGVLESKISRSRLQGPRESRATNESRIGL